MRIANHGTIVIQRNLGGVMTGDWTDWEALHRRDPCRLALGYETS